MKIKIDGEYKNISFLSFFKGWILSWAIMNILIILFYFIIGVITTW